MLIGNLEAGDRTFDGLIDDVRLYSSALTASQIGVLYTGGASQVLGAISTDGTGPASWAASAEYCPPGDSATCNPPVAEWKFDEYTGVSAYDTSENNNTGTLTNGPTWQHGGNCKKGTCLYFDDTKDDYINAQSDTTLDNLPNGSFTVSAWVYKTDTTGDDIILTKGDSASGWTFWTAGVGGTPRWAAEAQFGTQDANSRSDTTVPANEWHHFTAVFDGTYFDLFVDGVEIDSYQTYNDAQGTYDGDTSDNLIMGSVGGAPANNEWPGYIDDVRIYDYARTNAQIAWEYNKGGPVGWWKFDECNGTTAYDSSGFGNNGTINIVAGGDNTSAGTCGGSSSEAWANGSSGKINASLDFDGNNDYVLIGDPSELDFDGSHSMTVSAWLMLDTEQWARAVSKTDNGGANDNSWMLSYNAGQDWLSMQVSYDGQNFGSKACQESGEFETNTWYHVVGYYDYENLRVGCYLDGVDRGYGTSGGQMHQGDEPVRIGTEDLDDSYWNGQIDEVKIWNYLLTEEQVKQQYNSGAVRFN